MDRWSYDEITMARVAAQAGVSKGTLYVYFSSKESLFLGVFESLQTSWHHEIDRAFRATDNQIDAAEAARIITRSLIGQEHFLRLYTLLHPILETNIDVKTATAFQNRRQDRISVTSKLIAGKTAGLTTDQAFDFLVLLDPILTGFSQVSAAAATISHVFENEGLSRLRIDPARAFRQTLTAVLLHPAGSGRSAQV